MLSRKLLIPTLFAAIIAVAGCDSGGTKVTGKVTFDDAPLESGSILFVDATGTRGTTGTDIHNGDFSLTLPSGSYKVQITAQKMTAVKSLPTTGGAKTPSEEMRNYIPARYHGDKSELTATVDGKPLSFDLKSDAKK